MKFIKGQFIQKRIDEIQKDEPDFMKVDGFDKSRFTVHLDGAVYDQHDMAFIKTYYHYSLPVLTNIIAKAIIEQSL